MLEILNKIVDYLKCKIDTILFLAILVCVCIVYNINSQTLNYILGRGTTLVYSYKTAIHDNYIENIESNLKNLNIKYKLIEEDNLSLYDEYDNDLSKISNTILISIPYKINTKNVSLFDKISDNIFDNLNEAKLVSIHSLNHNYHSPYSMFNSYMLILFITFLIWISLLLIFRFKSTKEKIIQLFKSKPKEDKPEIKKDIKYYLKKLFLDENVAESENVNLTYEILSTIVFVLVAVIVIRYFVGELRWIPSGSMRPTIVEKDRVFVEKLNFPTKKQIERGDILVFYPPSEKLINSPLKILSRLTGIFCKDIAYIKRVVGMPNDKLEIKRDDKTKIYKVYINDKPLDEPYIISDINWTACNEKMFCGPFVIPENKYFMMGDNRNNSQDSRFWGFLDEERIIGRANFMFFPFSRINVLRDKYFTLQKTKDSKEIYILNRY